MKIVVNMACGLANRMFQYSYYLYLKEKKYEVWVDFYRSGKLLHENVLWEEIFPNAPIKQASRELVLRLGGGEDILSKMRRYYFPYWTHVSRMPTAFDAFEPDISKMEQYVIGVFQNAAMVEAVSEQVSQAFSFTPFIDTYNKNLAAEMQLNESVAIHVRKGEDYQQRIWYQNTCPVEYYEKAVSYMQKHIENPKFYVFTDNKEWVKENFKSFEYILVDGNPSAGYGCHFDMQLMGFCRHMIISNSTYSWWGAYLNQTQGKIVIIPSVWFNPDSCDKFMSERVLCRNWIGL